jgi:hypothetical protein
MSAPNPDLKPWFREDLARLLMGVYLASRRVNNSARESDEFRNGFNLALASVGVIMGIRPESIMDSDDLRMLQPPDAEGSER